MHEFDSIAENYRKLHQQGLSLPGQELSFFSWHKAQLLKRLTTKEKISPLKILNFGCGIGSADPFLLQAFPHSTLDSTDVSQKSIDVAKKENAQLQRMNYFAIDNVRCLKDEEYDVIFVANVFHHIPFPEHKETLCSLVSKLRKNGLLFMIEHNPLNPITRKTFNQCPFDQGLSMLPYSYSKALFKESKQSYKSGYTLFFPSQLSRITPLEKYLQWCFLGAQYYFYLTSARA